MDKANGKTKTPEPPSPFSFAKENLGNKANVEYQIADIQIYEVDTTDWKKKMFKAHKMGYPALSGTGCYC